MSRRSFSRHGKLVQLDNANCQRKYWVRFIRGALKYDFPFEKEVNSQYLSPRLLWGYISSRISTFTPLELLDSAKKAEKLIQIVLKSYIFPRSAFSSQEDELFISLPNTAWESRVRKSQVGILSFGRIIVSIASPYCWCNGPRVQYLPIYGESLLLPDFLSEQCLILSRIGKKYSLIIFISSVGQNGCLHIY